MEWAKQKWAVIAIGLGISSIGLLAILGDDFEVAKVCVAALGPVAMKLAESSGG